MEGDGGGEGERALIGEMLARGYTPPAWLYDHWRSRLYELNPSWLHEFEQELGPTEEGDPSAEAIDGLMELMLTYSA